MYYLTNIPEFMPILAFIASFSALNDLDKQILRSYDLENLIFVFPTPENPYVDTKNFLLA